MDYFVRYDNRRLFIALAVSLLLHAAVLWIKREEQRSAAHEQRASRLDVTLAPQPPKPEPAPAPPPMATTPRREKRTRVMTVPRTREQPPAWSQAQRDEMDQFLSELRPTPAPRGRELAERAFEMAGQAAPKLPPDDEIAEMKRKFAAANVDPFGIELYFDALFKKLNRSAAMVPPERRTPGKQVAAVRVIVNHDGMVKDFRVLWTADQQSQIDFIRDVVQRAAPFPVFPEDIRRATDTIVLQICIVPGSSSGSATFSRMAAGSVCRAQ